MLGGVFAYRYFRDLADANEEIGRYAGGLETANEQLERGRDKVKIQRDRAQANLRKTFAVVDKFLTRVGEVRFATHYMEDERRKILEEALAFCEQFLAENQDDPLVRHETALANHRKASICRLLEGTRRPTRSFAAP